MFDRKHTDLFGDNVYDATFYNYSGGSYDPDEGQITGESRSSFATIQVEYVTPGMDTSVDVDGNSFSWDSSIRFPQDEISQDDLTPLDEDSERPTEVELSDPQESDATLYELHGYTIEQGSAFYMCRLIEQ